MIDLKWRESIVDEAIQEDNMSILEKQYQLELGLLNNLLKRNDHSPTGVRAFEKQFQRVNECAELLRQAKSKKSKGENYAVSVHPHG